MMTTIHRLTLLLLSFSSIALAENCLHGCPTGKNGQIVTRQIYTLQNNALTKFADWTAYQVTPNTIDGPSRSRTWKSDPAINAAHTLEPADYTNANAVLGTDRGHQVPLASFSNTAYWADTNYLSNITPQKADLNQGPWARLEEAERALARSGKNVFIVTGPLYEWYVGELPGANESHVIPSGYFKVLITNSNGWIDASAFIMEQNLGKNANFCGREVTIDQVEQRAGINIMPMLPAYKESAVEGRTGGLRAALGC
ncbi:DNA/RNA non-specific endonuclease [Permianibacter aggregans]|uniref:Endonuclease n=1 Tax=Permianibacter aggregans TaxID=1510150 RepID=A0A4R6U9V5_9GAMM|nr:DNA/RNA non-specific endonuclease [Permianibacter aggregans]QGX40692.1 DNA/RNA non-specific endonuclease [Permianibacter aggregans]TDQ43388.1 endonuclease G [Permianibacter aggregans]